MATPRQTQAAVVASCWVFAGIGALCTVGLIIATALAFTWALLVGSVLMAIITIALACAAVALMDELEKKSTPSVFGTNAEQELLTNKQKKTLKAARGEVLMDLAMLDVEREKENILHRQTMEAGDMAVPPHKTSFTNTDGSPKQLRGRDY
jgi:hypothetical protein